MRAIELQHQLPDHVASAFFEEGIFCMAVMSGKLVCAVLVSVAAFIAVATCLAQAQPQGQTDTPSVYRPGLGDLMTMTVQPRHIKLALAGRRKNWTYAAYELHELQEAFDRAAQAWPQWQSVPIAELMPAATKDPIAALARAIKDGASERFVAAYEHLTDACNACHQAANRAMVVIRVPDTSSFPDQDFEPPKP
jgi:hypothetical protein